MPNRRGMFFSSSDSTSQNVTKIAPKDAKIAMLIVVQGGSL